MNIILAMYTSGKSDCLIKNLILWDANILDNITRTLIIITVKLRNIIGYREDNENITTAAFYFPERTVYIILRNTIIKI